MAMDFRSNARNGNILHINTGAVFACFSQPVCLVASIGPKVSLKNDFLEQRLQQENVGKFIPTGYVPFICQEFCGHTGFHGLEAFQDGYNLLHYQMKQNLLVNMFSSVKDSDVLLAVVSFNISISVFFLLPMYNIVSLNKR